MLGCKFQGSGFKVQDIGFRVHGSNAQFSVQGLGFGLLENFRKGYEETATGSKTHRRAPNKPGTPETKAAVQGLGFRGLGV